MLPVDAFAEAITFLRLFDLKALAVTSSYCSSLAVSASTRIRWEKFDDMEFFIVNHQIEVFLGIDRMQYVATLDFPSANDMTEFIAAAFPNSIFEDVSIADFPSGHISDAVGRVADSVIVKGFLWHSSDMSRGDSLGLIRKFRHVKALQFDDIVSDDEATEIANLLHGSGVEEIQYYSTYNEPATLKKLALL